MSLSITNTKNFDNYKIVEIDSVNHIPRCYKVPSDRADSFQGEYKKNQKKSSWITNGLMLAGIMITVIPTYYFTKTIQNNTLKTIIGVSAGLLGGFCGTRIGNNIEAKDHTALLNKYKAIEIDPDVSKLQL